MLWLINIYLFLDFLRFSGLHLFSCVPASLDNKYKYNVQQYRTCSQNSLCIRWFDVLHERLQIEYTEYIRVECRLSKKQVRGTTICVTISLKC